MDYNKLAFDRVHVSKDLNFHFEPGKLPSEDSYMYPPYRHLFQGDKPMGLWYACGASWIRYAEEHQHYYWTKFASIWTLGLDLGKMTVLDTEEKMLEFTRRYAVREGKPTNPNFERVVTQDQTANIDWPRVGKLYSGIEICPHQDELARKLGWYRNWSVASGCIWKEDALVWIEKFGEV